VIGAKVGPYEVVSKLGEGGMGQVYRARDTKLGRDVALKILPATFAADPDRALRFEREARTLASLNHPHIAAIYGVEESAHAIVMELVPGDDLATRLRRGALPLAEALPIAQQIALALEAAHDQGIIHRDLKPANIKIRDDGTVKVLDFGLAKALDATSAAASAELANSPTLTNRATELGVILGTAAYMAPEQARGRAVDRRADIWAFGCVLFEMLAGRRAFEADDVSATLAEVIKGDAPIADLPVDLPASLRRLIARCLVKDPKRRLQAIGDARIEIEDLMSGGDGTSTPATTSAAIATVPSPTGRTALAWGIAAAAVVALAALAWWTAPWRVADPLPVVTLAADTGASVPLVTTTGPAAVLSPDGKTLLLVGRAGNDPPRLYVRRLDALEATVLPGTDGATDPFFSPDGEWIGYFAIPAGQLRKVRVTGGPSLTITQGFAPGPRGGTWLDDDTIVYTPHAVGGTKLLGVSANGGEGVPLGDFAPGEVTQRWPQALPGGRAVLYTGHTTVDDFSDASIMAMPIGGGPPKLVHKGGYFGRYLRSGHVLFVNQGTLFALPFDPVTLDARGTPQPVLDGVLASSSTAGAQFAVSDTGTLVSVAGTAGPGGGAAHLSWITRAGAGSTVAAEPIDWLALEFSPDGRQLAMQVTDGRQQDVVVRDLDAKTTLRLTTAATDEVSPVWSPDGRFLVYSSVDQTAGARTRLYAQRADGGAPPSLLLESDTWIGNGSFHPDGTTLVYGRTARADSISDVDLFLLPIQVADQNTLKAGPPRVFRQTPRLEGAARFSPDGKWIAYAAEEDQPGVFEIFVEPFPGPGGRWQVSKGNAVWPVWSRTKKELLYMSLTGALMQVPYTVTADSFRVGQVQPWTPVPMVVRSPLHSYALHPDGERVAGQAFTPTPQGAPTSIRFVFNVFEKLKALDHRR
jgi:serine/threonine-protein kinase